jgi:hypothetical protein
MNKKNIVTFVVVFTVAFLVLPAQFNRSSFTCINPPCVGIGEYVASQTTSWRWFGGYHMTAWQVFTPSEKIQAHWATYNPTPGALPLLAESVGLALAAVLIQNYLTRKRVTS